MKDYASFYGTITKILDKHPKMKVFILGYNWFVTKFMYVLYPLLLLFLYLESRSALMMTILVPGLSFLVVSVLRKIIDQPRPYETWGITPILSRHGKGESFPSRHVFSASMISMCFFSQSVWFGSFLLLLTAGLAVCRVLGGVHYPKDVLIAYAIGILIGIVLI